jgi:hypothetical protein
VRDGATAAVADVGDGALREPGARVLAQCVRFALKQAPGGADGAQTARAIRSALRRIFAQTRHLSALRRLGFCTYVRAVLRAVHDDEAAVDLFALDAAAHSLGCLSAGDGDTRSRSAPPTRVRRRAAVARHAERHSAAGSPSPPPRRRERARAASVIA